MTEESVAEEKPLVYHYSGSNSPDQDMKEAAAAPMEEKKTASDRQTAIGGE